MTSIAIQMRQTINVLYAMLVPKHCYLFWQIDKFFHGEILAIKKKE
jgi:hypothetical protein